MITIKKIGIFLVPQFSENRVTTFKITCTLYIRRRKITQISRFLEIWKKKKSSIWDCVAFVVFRSKYRYILNCEHIKHICVSNFPELPSPNQCRPNTIVLLFTTHTHNGDKKKTLLCLEIKIMYTNAVHRVNFHWIL